MNMKTSISYSLLFLFFLAIASCDTMEEAYWPGKEPAHAISSDVAEIRLNADGTEQEISISSICEWEATLSENENVFSITPTKGKGDGKITVSANANTSGNVKNSTLLVKTLKLDKEVKVDILQSSLIFEMENKDYPIMGEEGGEVDLSFNSSTGWTFEVRSNSADSNDVGSLDWFDFIPGISGDGDLYKTEVKARWKPNYTPEERVITLALTPENKDILQYITPPEPFKLRQKGGILPTVTEADTVSVSKSEINLRFSYSSGTPVEECGVILHTAAGEELKRVAAVSEGDSYPLSGEAFTGITGLLEGTVYLLEPYVRNLVGETRGKLLEVKTKADLLGVEIVGYDLAVEARGVTVAVTLKSDATVTEVGFSIYDDVDTGRPIATYSHSTADLDFTEEISSTDFLTPNTDYEIMIFARTPVNEARTERIPIRTKGMNADEGDNNTPDIGH